MHDPRSGRFFATDPLQSKYPWNSPFAFSENRVMDRNELEGLETGQQFWMQYSPAAKSAGMTSDSFRRQNTSKSILPTVLTAAVVVDVFVTRGMLTKMATVYFLGDLVHSAQMQTYYRTQGNETKAKTYEVEGAEASKFLCLGLAADGLVYTIGKVAQKVTTLRGLEGAKFAQRKIRSDEKFSIEGQEIYSSIAGTEIKYVDDLVKALTGGKISPKDLPINYIMQNGEKVILNSRTSVALERAGVPMKDWHGVNQTGKTAYTSAEEGAVTFDELAKRQLNGSEPSSTPPVNPKKK